MIEWYDHSASFEKKMQMLCPGLSWTETGSYCEHVNTGSRCAGAAPESFFFGCGWHVVIKKKEQRTSHRSTLCTWRPSARDQFSTVAKCVASLHCRQFAVIDMRLPPYTHTRTYTCVQCEFSIVEVPHTVSMLRSAKRLLPTQRSGSRHFQSHHRLLSSLAFMGWEISNFSSHSVEIANQDHILWHRNTHNCTENLLHWMFCMLYPSQKKDQNCLPPNLFINSSILQPSTQSVAGSGSIKTISRQVSASNRERPSTSRIFLSLAPSDRQFNMFSKGRWPVPLHNFINGHYLQSDRWTMRLN